MLTDLKIREFYIPHFPSMSLGQQAHHQQSESGFLSLCPDPSTEGLSRLCLCVWDPQVLGHGV